ncbi:MAG: anaerobic ribonucleoside-triphosphate reductase activating protein [Peptostreptococcaceae bacterium]|nr:anaerobic ribonucleoside-triphosphate reductase activating protein [Peptostreptococcaceae bacterium]
MNYADMRRYDASNWSGINSTLFVSGCTFNCKGCFNKVAQDFNYGKPYTKEVEDLFISYIKDKHVDGACLLGGEVFQQDLDIILNLVKRIKTETGKPIYVWSGYLWENLIQDEKKLKILKYIDVLIDGQFEEDKKDLTLKHKGSTNQREVNVKESLNKNKVVLVNG